MDNNKQNQGRERERERERPGNTIKTTAEYDHSSKTNEQFSLGFLYVK